MKCEERHRLWDLYSRSLDRVTACVNELAKASLGSNFTLKVIASQEADGACNAARYAWERHLSEHRGCSAQAVTTQAFRAARSPDPALDSRSPATRAGDDEIELNHQTLNFAPSA
jgi:hypothetical protein